MLSWQFVVAQMTSPSGRAPLAVALGAIAGALSRYYLGLWIAERFGTAFPYGTFAINLSGSFALGLLSSLLLARSLSLPPDLVLLAAVGGLGSYTTFATYELDSFRLLSEQRWLALAAYWLGSPVLGLLGLYLGTLLGRLWR